MPCYIKKKQQGAADIKVALLGLKLKEFLQSYKLNFSNFSVPKWLKKIKNK